MFHPICSSTTKASCGLLFIVLGTIQQGNKHGADGDSSGDGNKNNQTHKIWPIDHETLSPYNPEHRKGSRQTLLNTHT